MERLRQLLPFAAFSLILFCAFLFVRFAYATVQSAIGPVFSIAQFDQGPKLPGSSFDCVNNESGATCTRMIDGQPLVVAFDSDSIGKHLWSSSYGTCRVTLGDQSGSCKPHLSYNFRSAENDIPLIILSDLPNFDPAPIESQHRVLQFREQVWTRSINILAFGLALTFALITRQLLNWGNFRGFIATRNGVLTAISMTGLFTYFAAFLFLTGALVMISIVD